MNRMLVMAVVMSAVSAFAHTRANDEQDAIKNAKGQLETARGTSPTGASGSTRATVTMAEKSTFTR